MWRILVAYRLATTVRGRVFKRMIKRNPDSGRDDESSEAEWPARPRSLEADVGMGFWGAVGLIFLMVCFQVPVLILVRQANLDGDGWFGSFILESAAFWAPILVGWFWTFESGVSEESIREAKGLMSRVVIGAVLYVFLVLGVYGIAGSISPVMRAAWERLESPLHGPAPVRMLFGVFLLPLAEEILFRATILHHMSRRYSSRTALVLSSLLFALSHVHFIKMPLTFVMGLGLGWLYLRTQSILLPVLAHAVNNGLAFLLNAADPAFDLSAPFWSVLVPGTVVVGVLLAVVVVQLHRRLPLRENEVLQEWNDEDATRTNGVEELWCPSPVLAALRRRHADGSRRLSPHRV